MSGKERQVEIMKALAARIIEPKLQIPAERKMFTNHDLKVMMVPLLIEQLLQMVVGMVDTMMVSYAGEATVSGVSLDTTIYTVFIYLFVALASGGAVIVSQYIGAGERKRASLAASQIFLITGVFSVICMILVLVFRDQILLFLYSSCKSSRSFSAKGEKWIFRMPTTDFGFQQLL